MKVVSERFFNSKVTIESSNGVKKYYLEGDTIKMNIFNENNRRYRTPVIDEALGKYLAKFKLGKNTFGVLNHPDSRSEESNYVNPKEVSHLFVDIKKKDEDTYWTKSLVMDTPNGLIVKAFIDAGAILGISTRGFGESVPLDDNKEDIESYEFITLGDYVTDPSAPNAYLNAIMEGKNWLFDAVKRTGKEKQIAENLNRAERLKKMNPRQIQSEALKFFNEYFNILTGKKFK